MGDAADDAERRALEEVEGEVVEVTDEHVEEARNLPAVRASEAIIERAEITPAEVKAQRDKIVQVMREVMVAEQHYGRIPGVNKPTLLKPGAELLAVTLRLAPTYKSERIFHEDGHLTVFSKCTLVHIPSGLLIAEGEGLCTSREKKYAYRGSGRTCPECGATGTIMRSKYPPREGDYEGASTTDDKGWFCYGKKGGCGANFPAVDERITSQEDKPIPNPDLADTFNTVLKMGNKRALIAATLNGTAASDIFTQDVEDGPRASGGGEPEVRQESAGQGAKLPKSWSEITAILKRELGEHEADVWFMQAREVAAGDKLPAPSPFQRMQAVCVDLLETDDEWRLRTDAREAVQRVFAGRLEGAVLPGPPWALTGAEAEAGTPSRESLEAVGVE